MPEGLRSKRGGGERSRGLELGYRDDMDYLSHPCGNSGAGLDGIRATWSREHITWLMVDLADSATVLATLSFDELEMVVGWKSRLQQQVVLPDYWCVRPDPPSHKPLPPSCTHARTSED